MIGIGIIAPRRRVLMGAGSADDLVGGGSHHPPGSAMAKIDWSETPWAASTMA